MRKPVLGWLALVAMFALAMTVAAQPPAASVTKISLVELHCAGCLKTVAKELGAVPGVATIQGDLPSKTVFVTHKAGVNPSPKALWDAILKADQQPVKLEGPSGTFTAKPKS